MTMPIVTNVDRDWALAQIPDWARLHNDESEELGEIVDDGAWLDADKIKRQQGPSWFVFVVGEIERFEQFFSGQDKSYSEWTALWRNSWWPKRREEWAYKHMTKKKTEPFYRKGTHEFSLALHLATAQEKRMWLRFGIAQFNPEDPRVKKITEGAAKAAATSRRVAGGAA